MASNELICIISFLLRLLSPDNIGDPHKVCGSLSELSLETFEYAGDTTELNSIITHVANIFCALFDKHQTSFVRFGIVVLTPISRFIFGAIGRLILVSE